MYLRATVLFILPLAEPIEVSMRFWIRFLITILVTYLSLIEVVAARSRSEHQGWLGVSIQPVTPEVAEALGMKEHKGALIAQVLDGAPAANAGLKAGDVILAVNGEPISESHEVPDKISRLYAGNAVHLSILRNGEPKNVIVKLGERPPTQEVTEAKPNGASPNFAYTPSIAELEEIHDRATALYKSGKYGDAIPLLQYYTEATKRVFGENAPQYAIALNNFAQVLRAANRLSEAEPLMRRALTIIQKNVGPDHPALATALKNLASLLRASYKLAEAEALYRRALDINEKTFGSDHPSVAICLNDLALVLQQSARFAEAEALLRRAIAISIAKRGPTHVDVATSLDNLGMVYRDMNRLAEAEPMLRQALAITEKSLGPDDPSVAVRLNNLGLILYDMGRFADAEPIYRRALAIDEKSLGPEHTEVANVLNNLAESLRNMGRYAAAESVIRRAIAIKEKNLGPLHPSIGTPLNNLALVLQDTNRLAEAESTYRRAIEINEKSLGDHPLVGTQLSNLALILRETNRHAEAESAIRRAIAIYEKSLGSEHPYLARALNTLAMLLLDSNRNTEAEKLFRRSLAIDEQSLGPEHQQLLATLLNLTQVYEERGNWAEAATYYARAEKGLVQAVLTGRPLQAEAAPNASDAQKAALNKFRGSLRGYARALYHTAPHDPPTRSKSFELAEQSLQNSAAEALSSMAARFAKGNRQLAEVVREQQDLFIARESNYRNLDLAIGRTDSKTAEAARAAIEEINKKLVEKQTQLRKDFPDYAELVNPRPPSITDAQALLSNTEALLLFADVPQWGKLPEETIVFALTRTEARWTSLALGSDALHNRVTALRCGLDSSAWEYHTQRRETCIRLLQIEASKFDPELPFDANLAYNLYRELFGGIEDLVQGKSLLIVPSGALTTLPFEVLVTAEPNKTADRFQAYKTVAFLGSQKAITILPSVASLQALGTAKNSAALSPYLGFGNPLVKGPNGNDESAWSKQDCSKASPVTSARLASATNRADSSVRGSKVDVASLLLENPLPGTTDEVCAIAVALNVADLNKAVFLGEHATVSKVKELSKSDQLADARIVLFATHGLVAGDTAKFAQNKAEPALLMTPPPPEKASDEDNGLLTASEVAQLKLNADWVVMSACNTAAGGGENAEALSGLARAFFYAGARSLLVSHWPVDTEAAVQLTTGAVNALKADPAIGRAEALRRSISAYIATADGQNRHPSVWAPFVLVGNGGQ
jgi:tetratricopeptide (TPR) repeat protein